MSYTSPALIDWQNPLTDHPLCDGLVDGWIVAPGRRGWSTGVWQSLRLRNNGGFLFQTWSAESPVGGWGSVAGRFTISTPIAAQPLTIIAVAKTTSSANQTLVTISSASNNQYGLGINGLKAQTFLNDTSGSVLTTETGAYTLGSWGHFAAVFASSTSRSVYRNGGNAASTSTPRNPTGMSSLYLGSFNGSSSPFFGSFSQVLIYSRALSAAEVAAHYEESRRGYPNMLRRLPTRRYFVAPAAGGFQPWFARNSTTVIGASGGFSA